jgi:hypothetical protein
VRGDLGHLDDPAWPRRVHEEAIADRHGDVLGPRSGAFGEDEVAGLQGLRVRGYGVPVVDLGVRGAGDLAWLSPIEFEEKYYADQATAERTNLKPRQPTLTC